MNAASNMKIGEIREIAGIKVKCVEYSPIYKRPTLCDGCEFTHDLSYLCNGHTLILGSCCASKREDGRNIVFKFIKEE